MYNPVAAISCGVSTSSSPLSAVHKVTFYPVTNLGVFEGRDSHRDVKFLRRPLSLHPLMSRKHTYHLPLPAPPPPVPHPGVDPRAAGPGLRVAVLVQQVGRLLASHAETIHQLTRTVVVEPREVDPSAWQLLGRGTDPELHVAPFVGFLEFDQSVVVVHPNIISVPFNPALGHMGAFGSDPLELHFLVGGRGVRRGATLHMVVEVGVKGRRLRVSLLRFQKANAEPLGSFHVVFTIVDTMGSCEHMSVPNQCPRAASGQLDRHREGIFEQEVLPSDAEAAIVAKDLSLSPDPRLLSLGG